MVIIFLINNLLTSLGSLTSIFNNLFLSFMFLYFNIIIISLPGFLILIAIISLFIKYCNHFSSLIFNNLMQSFLSSIFNNLFLSFLYLSPIAIIYLSYFK